MYNIKIYFCLFCLLFILTSCGKENPKSNNNVINKNLINNNYESISLTKYTILTHPILNLWANYPGYNQSQKCLLNGENLNDLRTRFKSNIGCASTFGHYLNSLIKPEKQYKFEITLPISEETTGGWEPNIRVGVAAYIIAKYDEKDFHYFDDVNNRIQDFQLSEKENIEKYFQDTESTKFLGGEKWLGTKEEITGKEYKIEMNIDGSNPSFEYTDVEVKDFQLQLKASTEFGFNNEGFNLDAKGLKGDFKLNGVPIFHKSGGLQFNTLIVSHWQKFLQKGNNVLSFVVSKKDGYEMTEEDYFDVIIQPYDSNNTDLNKDNTNNYLDQFLNDRVDGDWGLNVNIDDYPTRCWEGGEKYDPIIHKPLIEAKLKNFMDSIDAKDQDIFNTHMAAYLEEKELFSKIDENYFNNYLKNLQEEYSKFSFIYPLFDIELDIKIFMDDRLIQVDSSEYASLYYIEAEQESGKKKYIELETLPNYMVIKNGKAEFCMDL